MDDPGPSILQPTNINVDIEARPTESIHEKNRNSGERFESPSWPKINQDGTPEAPSQNFQKRYYSDRYFSKSEYGNEGCELKDMLAMNRLANLSIAYYQQDLGKMEDVLRLNGGVIDDVQLRHLRQTLKESCTAIENARQIERMIDEKKQDNSFWPDQNLDRVVKFTTLAVSIVTFPVAVLVSSASIRFARENSDLHTTDPKFAFKALNSALKDYRPMAEFVARIIIAIIGAGTLLTSMIILSLVDPPMPYRVLTVCLCVIGFSTVAAVTFRPTTTDLMGMVGAYTGILIVYVGAS